MKYDIQHYDWGKPGNCGYACIKMVLKSHWKGISERHATLGKYSNNQKKVKLM